MSNVYSKFAQDQAQLQVATPQSQAIPGREAEMAQNNAGGYTFVLDNWGILDRFLMIGSEGGSYYVGERDVTKQSFTAVKACIADDGVRVVNRALEYSIAGRAPKNDPAVVALALCAVYGNEATVQAAYAALPKIARTGTWLFLFVSILDSLGKWNAAAKRGVAAWYTARDIEKLTVQLLKYQQRNGWAHRDVLRLAHVKPTDEVMSNLFRYVVKGELEQGAAVPQLLVDFEYLKRAENKADVIRLIEGSDFVTWEMVPTQFLSDRDVLFALLKNMGMTAVIRKLGILTAHGVIGPMSAGTKLVLEKLQDVEALRRGRVHPVTVLQALKQYSAGVGHMGKSTWIPNQRVVDALNDTFYAAFDTIEKNNESYLLGVDCSGSMFLCKVNGSPNLTAADVAAVMALAIAKTSADYVICGFSTRLVPLKISPSMRLDTVLEAMRRFKWGGTDCAQPALYAAEHNIAADKLITITDNETWAGLISPTQALAKLRQKVGKPVAQVVIGTSVSQFTIADPTDARQLDIAGFDSAAPQIIAQL